jgi:hypothetical protein
MNLKIPGLKNVNLKNFKFKLQFNQITILLSAIITLIVVALAISSLKSKALQSFNIEDEFNFSNLTIDNVDKIEITQGKNGVTLDNVNGTWYANVLIASTTQLENFFEAIQDTKIQKLVSSNSDNFSTFEVDNENGIFMKFYDIEENELESLVFGKSDSVGEIYLRKKNSNNVYLADTNAGYYISVTASEWEATDASYNSSEE